jgi:phage tail-like protein
VRGALEGLESPHPLGAALPGLYHDDDFLQRFTSALDQVLAPILSTLDNLTAYFDPFLAPSDFVPWLAEWVGLKLDEDWPLERQRALVARSFEIHRWRGTAKGLAAQVALFTGCEPEVVDSGGCSWSSTPGATPPGSSEPRVIVRIRTADPASVDRDRLDQIVAEAKPAHVTHEIEVVP